MLPIISIVSLLGLASASDWTTYPAVPKTASINGFADRIYDELPVCAQSCVKKSTASTPCPYWDTGCLCVTTPWASDVADCIAGQCRGADVEKAQSLALDMCKRVGAWEPYWIVDAEASSSLAAAAAKPTA